MLKSPFIQEIARGRLLGHPIHVMFASFPSVLFPLSFIFEFLAAVTDNALMASASFYAMAAGLIGGVAAATFGAMDYFNIPNYTRRWKVASRHALINIAVLLGFSIYFAVRLGRFPDLAPFSGVPLMFMAILAGMQLYSNFLGGELIFRYQMGIIEDEPRVDDPDITE